MLHAISLESASKQRGIKKVHEAIHKDCLYYDTNLGSLDKNWTR